MKILNLYAGIGGNRKLWGTDGTQHEITAVESEQYIADAYKKLYPQDTVIVADAHQYLLDHYQEFDFIWSSPPCPTHSRMRHSLVKSPPCYPDMKLYEEIIFLNKFYKGNWVVENVIGYYKPLVEPKAIIDRHYIWSNAPIESIEFERYYNGRITDQSKETLAAAYAIVIPEGTKNQRKLLRNAVMPDAGLHILTQVTDLELKAQDKHAEVSSNPPKLNQLIYTQVLELIGEDESIAIASLGAERDAKIMASPLMQRRLYYNQLKAKLRAKAKAKYIGGSDE